MKLIIDTDPGVDDAMAILMALASPEFEILGLTTIFGNASTEITTTNALTLLETVGLERAIPTCVDAMTAKGCFMSPRGRLCIPRSLVEDTLASCARHFVLHARDPKHDMEPWDNKVYFGTAGAANTCFFPEVRYTVL